MIDHNFWLGVAGLGYTAGTLILGRMIGIGKKVEKLEALEKAFTEVKSEFSQVNKSLIFCQNNSAMNRGQISAEVAVLQKTALTNANKIDSHTIDREVHTDREWREATIERVEKIAHSIGIRIQTLETSICSQLDGIRIQMRNGHSNGGNKLS